MARWGVGCRPQPADTGKVGKHKAAKQPPAKPPQYPGGGAGAGGVGGSGPMGGPGARHGPTGPPVPHGPAQVAQAHLGHGTSLLTPRDREALRDVRVIQRNLVYVVGLAPHLAKEEVR
jgi:hypothetical protein